jgi:NADP-dependent 3-hydroxy acid dehydrogenase YdfG
MLPSSISKCFGYTVDITAREQVASLAARMRRQMTDVSMVVSNAGTLTSAPLNHLRPDTITKMIEVNLLAHFWVIIAFIAFC